jgi:tetratricopeptide (TPR) repeat protein
MTQKESILFRLTELMFQKQQTFLLLDELYEDEIIGSSIRNIQIDSPFQQLLFEGVLSQYIIDDSVSISFNVEAYFQHLLARVLEKDSSYIKPESLLQLLKENKLKGLPEAISNLLSFDVDKWEFSRLTNFIDLNEEGNDTFDLCVMPIIQSLLKNGVKETIEVLLENHTENDWKILLKLNNQLERVQLYFLKNKYLLATLRQNPLNTHESILLGLESISELNSEDGREYLDKIHLNKIETFNNPFLLYSLGNYELKIKNYHKALQLFYDCLNKSNIEPSLTAASYLQIGFIYTNHGEEDKGLDYYNKAVKIYTTNNHKEDLRIIDAFYLIADYYIWKMEMTLAFEFNTKVLDLRLKYFGRVHLDVAKSYEAIAWLLDSCLGAETEQILIYYNKSLEIRSKIQGEEHLDVAILYYTIAHLYKDSEWTLKYFNKALSIRLQKKGFELMASESFENIAGYWDRKGNHSNALDFYKKSLDLCLKNNREKSHIAHLYYNIGECERLLVRFKTAIIYYNLAYKIEIDHLFLFRIAQCHELLNEKEKALKYFIDISEVRRENFGLNDSDTIDSINDALRLAKQLNKENELPDWIKNYKTE